jgi:hypothetical protein
MSRIIAAAIRALIGAAARQVATTTYNYKLTHHFLSGQLLAGA